MKQITLYSDGCSLGNPGAGGWCGILSYKGAEKLFSGGEPYTTNNRMELKAVIETLKMVKEPCCIEVVSDSSYVVNGINEWLKNWVRKGFKNVKNPDLWSEYIEAARSHKVYGKWVKGHAGHPQNERCDEVAKEEARKYKSF